MGWFFIISNLEQKEFTVEIDNHKVDILLPQSNISGNILILPGWNYDRRKTYNNCSFCQEALDRGYSLIMPEMAKSNYQPQIYPETRPDWTSNPTRIWLTEEMIPQIQKDYKLLTYDQNNYLYGISTGGRGVAIVALHTNDLFEAGACLSGDFDQRLLKTEPLYTGYLGNYDDFPLRWQGMENPYMNADKFKMAFYIAHAQDDEVADPFQSKLFYERLNDIKPNYHRFVYAQKGGHNFEFWGKQTKDILKFFYDHRRF